MGNWKDLGVVPDSDDEVWDSQESQRLPICPSPPTPPPPKPPIDNIWDFRNSSSPPLVSSTPVQRRQRPVTKPCNTSQQRNKLPLASQILGNHETVPTASRLKSQRYPTIYDRESPDPLAGDPPTPCEQAADQEIARSPPIPEVASDPSSPSAVKGVEDRPQETNNVHEIQQEPGQTESNGIDVPAEIQRDEPAKGRRSLRPRKPIQEHPYLLENAQYSRYMKTHGMKPVRISAEEQAVLKRTNQDDSQEYVYNDSQPESGGQSQDVERPRKKRKEDHVDKYGDGLAAPPSPRSSSPQRHLRASSEQSPAQMTDNTSVNDDDDFPDILQLVGKRNDVRRRSSSKSRLAESAISKKWRRTIHTTPIDEVTPRDLFNAWEFTPSPPRVTGPALRDTDIAIQSQSPHLVSVEHATAAAGTTLYSWSDSRHETAQTSEPFDRAAFVSDDRREEGRGPEFVSSDAESDSEFVRKTGKRIRGVLPASWLRLDQEKRSARVSCNVQRLDSSVSPDRRRLGLAVKKSNSSQYPVPNRDFLDEFSADDDDEAVTPTIEDSASFTETTAAHTPCLDMDDGASVVEEDVVDWMLPGAGSRRRSSREPPHKKRKTQQRIFKGEKRKNHRQPKISNVMDRMKRPRTSNFGKMQQKFTNKNVGHVQRAISPPALSIVDFAESSAPKFIRIAARTASRRKNMGRSKPSGKNINLGNRSDNVDALSVLHAWQSGKFMGQDAKSLPYLKTTRLSTVREPLGTLSTNVSRFSMPSSRPDFSQPQKLARQVSMDDFVRSEDVGPRLGLTRPARVKPSKLQQRTDYSRPAQLEADALQDDSNLAITARDKVLDLMFRKSRREILAPTFKLRSSSPGRQSVSVGLMNSPAGQGEQSASHLRGSAHGSTPEKIHKPKGSRVRKSVPPRHLDLEAPQFLHANDPISEIWEPVLEDTTRDHVLPAQGIITGLGVFGTHYTQHFDIFPLHQDTYFHRTTILGSGLLKKALTYGVHDKSATARPLVSFVFLDHQFSWSAWTDETSSELGLLFDLMVGELEINVTTAPSSDRATVVTCAEHILEFMLEAVNTEEVRLDQVVERASELLLGFLNQTHHLIAHQKQPNVYLLSVNTRLLLCALVVLRMCRGSVDLSLCLVQMEDVLKQCASTIINQLLQAGLSEVRRTYADLQLLATRERGIRSDNVVMTSWVVVIKALSSAEVPRAGFWDVAGPVMAGDVVQSADARELENLWRDMFTLLPLGEFDDFGVMTKNMRFSAPLQGWNLPQKLVKAVLESYQSNQRQSPSFNEYCRTLLGRCHHLINQWGWHRCVPIVGTIFDFFGHQDLSHLRNEEVYKSPRFLEDLGDSPCLSVEPEDRCFHIFLKILAIAIQNMTRSGLTNDVRNLIARCLPNHNRQYSKEQTIHSRDLASLRNHHDLLCTLYWASPLEHRRPVDLIEQLVQPATSHKEACLINLRAWRQLACFVVSSGGSLNDYRPFMSWQNNVFHQILSQYSSAAADVQHQLMSLAKEDRNSIQQRMLDGIVATNQAAAKDVLHASVMASLEVMRHCPSLTSAMFSFNVNQMHKVFTRLNLKNGDIDWGIVRPCFDTIDLYVNRIEELGKKLRESSNESASSNTNHEFEDAVDFLDDKIVESFFGTVRRAMRQTVPNSASQIASASVVVEKAVVLCARIASFFIDGGKRHIQHFFSVGKYSVFQAYPEDLSLTEKKFVPLFVATLLKNHIFSFAGIKCSHFEIWITSLVKPFHSLKYETYLTETLQSMDVNYIKNAGFKPGSVPNYASNRHLFACGISYMRNELRRADAAQRRTLRAKYEKLLKLVMRQMRLYIQSLDLESAEHQNYVGFIREIIDLIKSYGADMCAVDPFYYQFSAEYSPAQEDPQLHAAGILAYGLRLAEGETTAGPQLFYYLYNHFKAALANGQLDAERKIIEQGMKADSVLIFVIESMLPAIIRASCAALDIWPLLDVYSQALKNVLGCSWLPREIPGHCSDGVVGLLRAITDWTRSQARLSDVEDELTPAQAHILNLLVGICNSLRPTLICWLMSPSPDTFASLQEGISRVTNIARHLDQAVDEVRKMKGCQTALPPWSVRAFAAEDEDAPRSVQVNPQVHTFTQTLIREVQSSWVITPELITIKVAAAPSTQPGPQSTQGVRNNLHQKDGLVSEILSGLRTWVSVMLEAKDERRGRRPRRRRNYSATKGDM